MHNSVGDDITDNIRITQMVPQSITTDEPWGGTQAHPLRGVVELIGEVYMPLQAFAAANAEREELGLDLWANPRNAASGAMKLRDAAELSKRPLAFVRHDGGTPWIGDIAHVDTVEVFSLADLLKAIEVVRHTTHAFAIDGAVVKLPTGKGRDVLGMGTRAPNWACAFKFKPVQVTTILEDIFVQVGRTGVLTPVARLTPALIDGTTVSQATLNNEAWIREKGLQVGDTVTLAKAGMIIPELLDSVTHEELVKDMMVRLSKHPTGHPLADAPEQVRKDAVKVVGNTRPHFGLVAHLGGKCPSCGSTDLQKQEIQTGEGAKWHCMNSTGCPAQLAARIEHMCSRGCLDIEGIGSEMAAALADAMGSMNINNPLDLMSWTVGDLQVMTWVTESGGQMTFGESRATKAAAALARAKSLPLHRWLRALGIPSIGENTSKEISRLCLDVASIHAATFTDGILDAVASGEAKDSPQLQRYAISGHLGPVSCAALKTYAWSDAGVAVFSLLKEWGVTSENYDPTPTASNDKPLFGKSFAITGTLSVGRDEIKALIESKGGKVSGSVSAKTNFLVAGEGGGQKADKARAAGVTILDEAALRAML